MTDRKPYYHVLKNGHTQALIRAWWLRLQRDEEELKKLDWPGNKTPFQPGVRAELRRCHSVDDVLLTQGFRSLWLALDECYTCKTWQMVAWATVAAVLADVRGMRKEPFAESLGSQKEPTGKPFMSELRFAQLQKSDDADTFLRRARRAVALLDRKADVLSLADSILHWHQEKQGDYSHRPEQRLAVRWATGYFTALAEYQK